MKKNVTISIKGSLISLGDENPGGFELMTDGIYTRSKGLTTFSYEESDLTGINGLFTTFNIEPDRIILRRGSNTNSDMVFSEDQKHHFLYETPYGSITMGIDTHSITKNFRDDGGHLEIVYDIEVDSIPVSSNLFEIDIMAQ
ncbi:MAG: DUF1934 domain-containing protein [Oscillospiraceae bacterium]|nr:DUF1934 domain-containing protein [Oscillospiraceae bacterium]